MKRQMKTPKHCNVMEDIFDGLISRMDTTEEKNIIKVVTKIFPD
jgi:hypothetical protein